jgi:DNA-binding response OmpR family regulator
MRRPVLIIEDNADLRDGFELSLQLEGFDVRTAADGATGLIEMRREPLPCVVVLDLHMPDMDGFEFREEQRKDPALMAIPVIIYSGHHDVAGAAAEMGIEAYFQKPFDTTEILSLIRRYSICETDP